MFIFSKTNHFNLLIFPNFKVNIQYSRLNIGYLRSIWYFWLCVIIDIWFLCHKKSPHSVDVMRDLIWLQYVPRQPPSIARPDYANEQNILSPQNLVFLAFLSYKKNWLSWCIHIYWWQCQSLSFSVSVINGNTCVLILLQYCHQP